MRFTYDGKAIVDPETIATLGKTSVAEVKKMGYKIIMTIEEKNQRFYRYSSGAIVISDAIVRTLNEYTINQVVAAGYTIFDPLATQGEQMSEVSHDCWEVADAVMGVSRRVLLRGKPGTGKTYHAVNSALREGQAVYQVTMTEETPAAEIRGHYILKDNEYVWADGPAIMAWREGARLVINEIDHASEDCLSLLFAIMDDPEFAQLTLPTGETVKPSEGFQLIATMNGVPEDLPDALQDRLPVDIEVTELNPEALARLPEDLREPAKNTALAKSTERGISIRMWLEFATLREELPKKLDDPQEALEIAAKAVFGDNYQKALTALTISGSASPAQTMDDYELTEQDNQFLAYVRNQLTYVDLAGEPQAIRKTLSNIWTLSNERYAQTLFIEAEFPENDDPSRFQRQDGSWIPMMDV